MSLTRFIRRNIIDYKDKQSNKTEKSFSDYTVKELFQNAWRKTYTEGEKLHTRSRYVANFLALPSGDMDPTSAPTFFNFVGKLFGYNSTRSIELNLLVAPFFLILNTLIGLPRLVVNIVRFFTEFLPLATTSLLNSAFLHLGQAIEATKGELTDAINEKTTADTVLSYTLQNQDENGNALPRDAEGNEQAYTDKYKQTKANEASAAFWAVHGTRAKLVGYHVLSALVVMGFAIAKLIQVVARAGTSPKDSMKAAYSAGKDLVHKAAIGTFNIDDSTYKQVSVLGADGRTPKVDSNGDPVMTEVCEEGHGKRAVGAIFAVFSLALTAVIYTILFPLAIKAIIVNAPTAWTSVISFLQANAPWLVNALTTLGNTVGIVLTPILAAGTEGLAVAVGATAALGIASVVIPAFAGTAQVLKSVYDDRKAKAANKEHAEKILLGREKQDGENHVSTMTVQLGPECTRIEINSYEAGKQAMAKAAGTTPRSGDGDGDGDALTHGNDDAIPRRSPLTTPVGSKPASRRTSADDYVFPATATLDDVDDHADDAADDAAVTVSLGS